MTATNQAWLENRPTDMQPYLHPDVTMVLPGFTSAVAGREALLAGFAEFCTNARVLKYHESHMQIQVVGNVAVVNFRFDMLYERAAYLEQSTGRDIWIFEWVEEKWLAVWRTMVELQADRQPGK